MSASPVYRITISSSRKHFHQTRELIHFISRQHGLGNSDADLVEMAVSEACHNVLRHGSTTEDQARCHLEIRIDEKSIKAVIRDKGEVFEFDSIEPFDINQDFMQYKNGGLGIPLMKVLMDDVRYERKPENINELTLIKYLKPRTKKERKRSG
ncbi:MAG: ATP-binding protein [Candidatus Neomarinimicrobiota bacterium]